MQRPVETLVTLLLVTAVAACSSTPHQAPVSDRTPAAKKTVRAAARSSEPDWRPQTHTVQKGDTLYAIALEYGYDYKELAEWNGIGAPYVIRIGQQLRLSPGSQEGGATAAPLKTVVPVVENKVVSESHPLSPSGGLVKTQPKAGKVPYSIEAENASKMPPKTEAVAPRIAPALEDKPKTPEAKTAPVVVEDKKSASPAVGDDEDPDWGWPAKGKVIAVFSEGSSSKGVDIAGKAGQAVLAAAPGKVVYSGSGLRGYGKLVIIKHNKTYLSAYAHNSQILVKEGQSVLKGQRIAEMGDSDADQVKLHFEIRRLGKPVDPLKHLPEGNG
jgi:lipoprotein NlpD